MPHATWPSRSKAVGRLCATASAQRSTAATASFRNVRIRSTHGELLQARTPADVPGLGSLDRVGVGAAAPADATVNSCSVYVEVPNRALSHAGVTSVRNTTCAARRAIRRYGRRQTNAPYGDVDARFRLGPWSCIVYLHNYELWKARCVWCARAFRVDYGF